MASISSGRAWRGGLSRKPCSTVKIGNGYTKGLASTWPCAPNGRSLSQPPKTPASPRRPRFPAIDRDRNCRRGRPRAQGKGAAAVEDLDLCGRCRLVERLRKFLA